MLDYIFSYLNVIDSIFWSYFGFAAIMFLGIYLTLISRFFQFRVFFTLFRNFIDSVKFRSSSDKGFHPLRVFFTSVGGMLGVGNIVGIVTAVQIGGPGALFWIWIAAFFGSIIKYAEIFLGHKFRVSDNEGSYLGGPIRYLTEAFSARWLAPLFCTLFCVYGAEVYQFSSITHIIAVNGNFNHMLVVIVFLLIILIALKGEMARVSAICTVLVPFFSILYIGICLWFIGLHLFELPVLIKDVFSSAFSGRSAVGGFIGGGILVAMQQGVSRSAYSADIGFGYDSLIQCETSSAHPEKQAQLAMLGTFFDNFICTLSVLIVLCSGVWASNPPTDSSIAVQLSLSALLPGMPLFMTIFLTILVYTTLISYLIAGCKCAKYLHPRFGKKFYLSFASLFLFAFSFLDQSKALVVMSIAGCLLLCMNLSAIFRLRRHVSFELIEEPIQQEVLGLEIG